MFRRRQQPTEQVRRFATVEEMERHARQLAATEALESMDAYTQQHGAVWGDSDHRTVNR